MLFATNARLISSCIFSLVGWDELFDDELEQAVKKTRAIIIPDVPIVLFFIFTAPVATLAL